MFCYKCGEMLEDDSSFCHNCGTKVQSEDTILQNAMNVHDLDKMNDGEQSKIVSIQSIERKCVEDNIKNNSRIEQKNHGNKLKTEKKKLSKKKMLIIAAAIISIMGIFVILNWEGKIDYEATVRSYNPFAQSQGLDYTCGEVFDKYIEKPKWEVHEEGNTSCVDISGEAKGIDRDLTITISVNEDEDNVTIRPESVSINGVTSSTQNEAVEFLYMMFWMYDEGYDDISELFSEEESVSHIEDSEENTYDSILSLYAIALEEDWSAEELENSGLNYLCSYYSDKSEIGYTILDIDHNGTKELLIGDTTEYGGAAGLFFDLYTIVGDEPVLVVSSGERDRYYLCSDGFIANEGSGSAFLSAYAYYLINSDGSLGLSEAVIYDSEYDSDNPWFYSVSGFDRSDYAAISEEVAQQIFAKHKYSEISFISFGDGYSDDVNVEMTYSGHALEAEKIFENWLKTHPLNCDVEYVLLDEYADWGNGRESFKYSLYVNGEEYWLYIDGEDGSIFIENEMEVMSIDYWYDATH